MFSERSGSHCSHSLTHHLTKLRHFNSAVLILFSHCETSNWSWSPINKLVLHWNREIKIHQWSDILAYFHRWSYTIIHDLPISRCFSPIQDVQRDTLFPPCKHWWGNGMICAITDEWESYLENILRVQYVNNQVVIPNFWCNLLQVSEVDFFYTILKTNSFFLGHKEYRQRRWNHDERVESLLHVVVRFYYYVHLYWSYVVFIVSLRVCVSR